MQPSSAEDREEYQTGGQLAGHSGQKQTAGQCRDEGNDGRKDRWTDASPGVPPFEDEAKDEVAQNALHDVGD